MAEDAPTTATDGAPAAGPELNVQMFAPLPTGTKLGQLLVQSVLGAGEMGITYVALHEATNRRFALKEFMPRAIAFRDGLQVRASTAGAQNFAWGLQRFLAEGRALARIKHPAIVGVDAVNEGNGTGYVLMPHESGNDLVIWQHGLRRAPAQDEHDKLASALLEGLSLVHEAGLLHLDITPASIIVRDDGSPVLVDFGAVRLGMRRRLGLEVPSTAKPFTAPEVSAFDESLIGARSDLYSVAAVLYTLATGSAPAPADRRILRDDLVPAAQSAKSKLRPAYLAAIDAGLRFRPDDRPQQAAQWHEALLGRSLARATARGPVIVTKPAEAAPLATEARKEQPLNRPAKAPDDKPIVVAAAPAATPKPRLTSEIPAASKTSAPELPKSETSARPGPQALDEADFDHDPEPAKVTGDVPLMENPGFRAVFYGAAGALGGVVAGAVGSVVAASIVWSSCFADSCVMPLLPYGAGLGAVVGLYFGARYGVSSLTPKSRTPSMMDL